MTYSIGQVLVCFQPPPTIVSFSALVLYQLSFQSRPETTEDYVNLSNKEPRHIPSCIGIGAHTSHACLGMIGSWDALHGMQHTTHVISPPASKTPKCIKYRSSTVNGSVGGSTGSSQWPNVGSSHHIHMMQPNAFLTIYCYI